MNDRQPGWYYRPNEGMRWWDGDSWSLSEPQFDGAEGPSTQDPAGKPAVDPSFTRKKSLPWLIVGLAIAAAGIVTILLLGRGNTQGDLEGPLPTAVGDLETPNSKVSPAHDMSVRPNLKPTDVPRTEGEVCALAVFVSQEYEEEISGAISGGGYATGDMTGLGLASIHRWAG